MSIVASPTALVLCSHQCGRAVRLPAGSEAEPVCEPCRKSDTLADAAKVLDEVRALAAGAFPFDALTPDERAEQLQAILQPQFDRPAKYPGFRTAADATLILMVDDPGRYCTEPGDDPEAMLEEALAELTRRLSAPTPPERDEIEQRCAAIDQH